MFGAGALGSVIGGFLSRRCSVTLIGREPHVRAISREGLKVCGIWGSHRFTRLRALSSVSEVIDEPFELVILTTKAYDTAKAVEEFAPLVGEHTAVLSMQNGIGNEELIAERFGAGRTLGGMAIFGAKLRNPGEVEVTVYAGECLVGELTGGISQRALSIARLFTSSGIPCRASGNIVRDKWLKAFYNIALNPLSAILGVPYGVLGELEETRELMREMLAEAFEVARRAGVEPGMSSREYYDHLLHNLLPPTSEHISSMLQDMQLGRRTEIDYLNGAIARLGERLGVPAPVNTTIARVVRAMERASAHERRRCTSQAR